MTSSNKRIEREQQFHDLRYTDDQQRQQKVSKFYSITGSITQAYQHKILTNSQDAKVIEYGCGKGSYACKIAKNQAQLVASLIAGKPGFKTLLRFCELIDAILLKLPIIRRQAWMVLIELEQPIK
jgi:hypothetical protein